MADSTSYNALIIDPNLDAKMRLKQATAHVVSINKVGLINTLNETLAKLELSEKVDVIFISSSFQLEAIKQFIKDARATKYGQDCAYVLVLGANKQEGTSIAANMLCGGDGFLCEPYSVDSLVAITTLASKVKKEQELVREKRAYRILLDDILGQLDLVCFIKGSGLELGASFRKLHEKCGHLLRLSEESLNVYFEVAIEKFIAAPLPSKFFQKTYSGVSSRVRNKLQNKVSAVQASDEKGK